MGTRIVVVRSAVVAALANLDAFSEVECRLGWKADSEARERLYTRMARFTHSPAAMASGPTRRREVGTFDLVLRIEGVGQETEETATRAAELGTIAEDWIATNKVPAGTGVTWLAVDGAGAMVERFADTGTLVELSLPCKYEARLTT